MEDRYNVYFAGQLREGQELAGVRTRMGKLFNADEPTLDKLFSGRNQLVKRDCDKATALKYKQAIESAGAVPVIRAVAAEPPTAADAAASGAMTAAEKIAALAAAPDPGHHKPPGPATHTAADALEGDLRLSPEGTAVLLPEERQAAAVSTVQTPDLQIGASGERLSAMPPPAPPPPDTSHLSEGPVGEAIPGLPVAPPGPAPDTSAIQVLPDGTDLSDCARPSPAQPNLDLSGIELAPAGSDVLEQRYRKNHDTPPPATDHLTLED